MVKYAKTILDIEHRNCKDLTEYHSKLFTVEALRTIAETKHYNPTAL